MKKVFMCIFYFPMACHHGLHAFGYAWKCFYLTITRTGMVPTDLVLHAQAIIPINHETFEKQKTEMMKNGIKFQGEKEIEK